MGDAGLKSVAAGGSRGVHRVFAALAVLLVVPALSGCFLGTERPDPAIPIPAKYHEAARGPADAAVPVLDWWRGFRSKELTGLIEEAQTVNLDIAVAFAQIIQADAQVGISGAPLLPSVTGMATAERM